jgi:hypothetical protein
MSYEKYPYPFHHNGWLVHIAIAIDPYDDQQGFVVVRWFGQSIAPKMGPTINDQHVTSEQATWFSKESWGPD